MFFKKNKKSVLILCTGNSCRSQMAEGVLKHYAGDEYDVYSAGTVPSGVNETAIQVMQELGIDISKQKSKHLKEFQNRKFDYVVTVCDIAKRSCPPYSDRVAKHVHWSFPDPPHSEEVSEKVLEEFRMIRDLIHEKFKKAAEKGFDEAN